MQQKCIGLFRDSEIACNQNFSNQTSKPRNKSKKLIEAVVLNKFIDNCMLVLLVNKRLIWQTQFQQEKVQDNPYLVVLPIKD